MNVWLVIILLLGAPNLANVHGIPWHPSLGPPSRAPGRPVDVMTDVINDLGVKLLDCYIEHPGNIAFSPTGLAFVLAALYEGSAGRTSRQIAHVLALPRDRRVTEIGLRDIHRRLRSYLNADAFLGGLTLNRDDIMLRAEYEDTLRFYGFDVGDNQGNTTDNGNATTSDMTMTNMTMDAVTQMSNNNGTTTPGPLTMAGVTDSTGSTSSLMMASAPSPVVMPNVTSSMDATTNPTAELITPSPGNSSGMSSASIVNMMNPITSVDGTAETLSTTPMSTTINSTLVNTQDGSDSTLNNPVAGNVMAMTPASTVPMGSTSSSTLGNNSGMNNSQIGIVNATATATPVTTVTSVQGTDNSTGNNSTAGGARSAGEMSSIDLNSTGNSSMNATVGNSTTLTVESVTAPFALGDMPGGMNQSVTMTVTMTNDENRIRKKRSIGHQTFSNYPGEGIWIDESNGWQDYNPSVQSDDSIINEDMTDLQFLVNGCDPSTISTATYTAALPFAYIAPLRAYGVEFPLDDPRYNVILLVPTEEINSRILAKFLHGKTLRHIRESMKLTWVRATIPSFMLRGFITLTPYLQKLGIRDAFEPRAADLSPMSPDLGIYARDVQQSIGVNIRNYMRDGRNDSTTTTTRNPYQQSENYLHTREPIPFTVDRPFLFFIVDTETSVALIAGRIDDPLNSRIL